jgi:VWFA-related protein
MIGARALAGLLLSMASASLLATQEARPTFRTWVDLVTVDAWVHESGRPLVGLTAADFLVRDNGTEQVVQTLGSTDSAHVIVGLDLSGSVDGDTLGRLQAGVRAVRQQLTSRDRISLFTFGADIRLLLRAAVPGPMLDDALARLDADGGTPLHDALIFGSVLARADVRPAVFLLLTDGRDTASASTATQALDVLRRTSVVVYPVGAGLPSAVPTDVASEYLTGASWLAPSAGDTLRLLHMVAEATGGEFLRISGTSDLARPFRRILDRYRQRYLITYTPTGVTAGGWHRIDVRLRSRKGTIVAREGYVARPPDQTESAR